MAESGGSGGAGGDTESGALATYLATIPADRFRAKNVDDLIEFECATSALEALATMQDKGISGAPVYELEPGEAKVRVPAPPKLHAPTLTRTPAQSAARYLGFIDALDLAALAVEEGLATKPTGKLVDTLMRWIDRDTSEPVGLQVNRSAADPFVAVAPDATVLDIARRMATGTHRVAVMESPSGGPSAAGGGGDGGVGDGVAGRVVGLATQTAVLRLIAASGKLGAPGRLTVGEAFRMDDRSRPHHRVITAPAKEPARGAFLALLDKHIHGLALVDDDGRMLTNLSDIDIRGLASETAKKLERVDFLAIPALDFVARSTYKPRRRCRRSELTSVAPQQCEKTRLGSAAGAMCRSSLMAGLIEP